MAGCLSNDPGDDETADSDDAADDGSATEPDATDDESSEPESPCADAKRFVTAQFEPDPDTVAAAVPAEHTDRLDTDETVVDATSMADDAELVDVSCSRTESDRDLDAIEELFETPVSSVVDLELELTAEVDGETKTETRGETWVELEGSWYLLPDLGGIEVDVEFSDDSIAVDATGEDAEVVVSVIDDGGDPVEGATVVVTDGTATLEEALVAATGAVEDDSDGTDDDLEAHQAVVDFEGLVSLPDEQDTGTLEVEIQPPAGSPYVDHVPNKELLVVDD